MPEPGHDDAPPSKPTAKTEPPLKIIHFEDMRTEHRELVGGKAHALGVMRAAGFPVPNGFCLTTHAMHQNKQALSEGLPGALKPLPGSVAVAKKTARYVLRKYDVPGTQSAWLETLRTGFSEFRDLLGDKEYLLGEFSIADITLAASLQVIEPPDVRYVPLGPASKQCWTRPELVGEFTDLLAWRNQIFEKHGRPYQG